MSTEKKTAKERDPFTIPGRWWRELPGDTDSARRFLCTLCPRACELVPGRRGFCFVRKAGESGIELTSYGKSSGFCIDPIEKKPLSHFYPGSSVLSFGTVGCNLACKFCQNWDISKARKQARLLDAAPPEQIADAALANGALSVAFTYNDPVIFAEYAIDTANACHQRGIKTVAVTAGYIGEAARRDFFEVIDAANIDLKAFTEDFYERHSLAQLKPVLDTIEYVANDTDTWLELTTLLIPGENDSEGEIRRMSRWIVDTIGPDVPIHFTAFHPDFRMRDKPPTPPETLLRARDIALETGIRFVYVGNVHDRPASSTYCPSCNSLLIGRDWHAITDYRMKGGECPDCGAAIPGFFQEASGHWGNRRQPVSFT